METQTLTLTVLESLRILDRVIQLAAGGAGGSLSLEEEIGRASCRVTV